MINNYKVINNSLQGITLRLCAGGRRENFECYAMLPDDCHEDTSSVNKPYQVTVTYAKFGYPIEGQFIFLKKTAVMVCS